LRRAYSSSIAGLIVTHLYAAGVISPASCITKGRAIAISQAVAVLVSAEICTERSFDSICCKTTGKHNHHRQDKTKE
jgi:ferritin-like protein